MTGYLSREITPRLVRALRQLPVVVLSGLRQTGKSTLLQNEAGTLPAATRWNGGDLSGLRAFLERTPACVAAVLAYNGKEAVKLDERLFAIPLGKLME